MLFNRKEFSSEEGKVNEILREIGRYKEYGTLLFESHVNELAAFHALPRRKVWGIVYKNYFLEEIETTEGYSKDIGKMYRMTNKH